MVVITAGATALVSLAVIVIGGRVLLDEAKKNMGDTSLVTARLLTERIINRATVVGADAVPAAASWTLADERIAAVVVFGSDRRAVAGETDGAGDVESFGRWPEADARILRVSIGDLPMRAEFHDLNTGLDFAAGAWIALDRRPFEEAARAFFSVSSVIGLLAVVVCGLLTAALSTAVTRTINRLGDAVDRMTEGEIELHHSEHGPGEITRLARRIGRLGERLEARHVDRTRAAAREDGEVRGRARYLEQTNRALIDLANRDPLTGLANRRRLELELERQIDLARQSGNPLAVIMMDLDNFKLFNDTAGHLAGDTLLRNVAEVLRARTRVTDIVVRWGGDEFCVLMPYTSPDRAITAAHSLIEAIGEATRSMPNAPVSVGASAGVACFPDDARESTQLIAAADAALYQVKESGRGGVFCPSGSDAAGTT
jgi:diguanylate cyclase (GGDEF)-like protein